jgi:hypothetical protein
MIIGLIRKKVQEQMGVAVEYAMGDGMIFHTKFNFSNEGKK